MGPFAAADGTFPHDVGFVYDLARKPTDALSVRGPAKSEKTATDPAAPAGAGPEAASKPASETTSHPARRVRI
jgi:hypothetical protein